jgi:hypothetical protein
MRADANSIKSRPAMLQRHDHGVELFSLMSLNLFLDSKREREKKNPKKSPDNDIMQMSDLDFMIASENHDKGAYILKALRFQREPNP